MNIAYIYIGDLKCESGVHKKIIEQIYQWRKYGNNVRIYHISTGYIDTFGNDPQHVFEHISNILLYRVNCIMDITKFADIVYMRYSFGGYDIYRLTKEVPTFIEINSNEKSEYKNGAGLRNKIKYWWNFINRYFLMRYIKGKVCVTYELEKRELELNHNIPCVVVPNSIIGNYVLSPKNSSNIIPKLVFIGTPNQEWHGVDKIIELAKRTLGRLEFILIGIESYGEEVPNNVKLCGYLSRAEYEGYLLSADIGIGSLALHRKNMEEACPLKIREYIQFGLPILIGYKDTSFEQFGLQKPEWICELSCCEDNVTNNIEKIVEFCYRVQGKRVTPEEFKFMRSEVYEMKRIKFMEDCSSGSYLYNDNK